MTRLVLMVGRATRLTVWIGLGLTLLILTGCAPLIIYDRVQSHNELKKARAEGTVPSEAVDKECRAMVRHSDGLLGYDETATKECYARHGWEQVVDNQGISFFSRPLTYRRIDPRP